MSDKKIRIQDDLYNYVNGEWIANAVIPDDKPRVGGFADLDEQVEKLLIDDFNKMENGELEVEDTNIKKAVKLFSLAKNLAKRNKDGLKPIQKRLAKIEKLENISGFNRNLKTLFVEGYPLPFQIFVSPNMTDTSKNYIYISGAEVILPDTTYYKEGMEQQKEMLLSIWSNMVAGLLKLTKLSEEDQAQYIKDALAFDAILATLVKSQEELSEYTKFYNPTKLSRVATLLKPVKFKKLLVDLYGEDLPAEISVVEPRYFKSFSTVFSEENFILYKHWAYIKQILESTSFLSEKIRDLGSIYGNALRGVTCLPTIEKQAYRIASSFFGDPIGLYYGKKYFGEDAKKDIIEMVSEIIETYKVRIMNNSLLSLPTREKAVLKLSKMVVKMGYPDKYEEIYNTLIFDENSSLYEAVAELKKILKVANLMDLRKPVNREEWVMPAHMVNACYDPFRNDITFPAAILQAPFYSVKQTRSQNLGGIGAVIGHEISHAFDNNGAKCDECGNINNWWTKEDTKNFTKKTKAMIKQFDGIELEWGKVNGSFIVSENIADNGGMAVTLDIMSRMSDSDYKEYFFNWARVWCMKARPEFSKLLLSVDVHGPAILRANIPPRNFDEWYDTFKVKKTDEMYIAPTKRVVIW